MIATRDGDDELVLIAGRQVVTAERLEVLALGCDSEFEDGTSLRRAIELVRDSGALAVIPWGFGKWWFGRGAILGGYLRAAETDGLFLGDNAGRLGLAPAPGLFRFARRAGIPILPGSDTFPMESESRGVGGYGFALDCELDLTWPAEGLKQALRSLRHQPPTFGRLESLGRFCRNQFLIHARKQGMRLWR